MDSKHTEWREPYGQLVRYVVCGVCTMLLNTLVYGLLYEGVGLSNAVSSIAAWFLAVIGAFIGNKYGVFRVRNTSPSACVRELLAFFGCRLATGALDLLIMVAAVDWLGWNSLLWKLIANGIVTVTNYGISRFWIFTDKKDGR